MHAGDVATIASSFPGVAEVPHRVSIRAFKTGGRIFATINPEYNRCCLRLSAVDQSVFSLIDPDRIHPVPKAWGRYGWTLFYYEQLGEEIIQDALRCAFVNMASEKWRLRMEG
ncbi:MAG: MmcQ/YjbR family DNA-binding protein [Sphingobacteriales bacterium]|jgi:hypothetical protein|nr:MmcQ/YjbR family DNA-binding protein [Sphingobacteriales bacterium]